MNFKNITVKEIIFLLLILIFFNLFLLNAGSPPLNCISADGKSIIGTENVECINWILENNPELLDLSSSKNILDKLNRDLLTKNIQKYADVFGEYKTELLNRNSFSGLKFSNDGIITNQDKWKINLNDFAQKTEFIFSKDNVFVKVPKDSDIDLTKFETETNFKFKEGEFYLKDPRSAAGVKILVKNSDDLVFENGKLLLNKGGEINFPGEKVSIINLESERVDISNFARSTNANSVSFYDDKIFASSSENGKYKLSFDDGRNFANGRGGILEFGKFSFGDESLRYNSGDYMTGKNVKKVQESLVSLGYDVGQKGIDGIYGQDTENAVTQFQKDNNLIADGIAGAKTKNALQEKLGDYYSVLSNGKTLGISRTPDGTYYYTIKNKDGIIYTVGDLETDSSSFVNTDSSDYFFSKNQQVYSSLNNDVKLSNPDFILEKRYETYKDIMEKVSADFTPDGFTSKKFNALLAGIAVRESSMGHPNGQVEINDALLMGYDDPAGGGKNRYPGAEKQIYAAANALKKAFNNENTPYKICFDVEEITAKSECILSVYNAGEINERGKKYAGSVLSYADEFENFLR